MDDIDFWMADLIHTLNTCSDEERKQLIDSAIRIQSTENDIKDQTSEIKKINFS